MRKLFLALLLVPASLHAQTTTLQSWDAVPGTTAWSYTTAPAAYNYTGTLQDVWDDTTVIGNATGGNIPITATGALGTHFWGMWDLESPATTGLGAPYYHTLDFAPISTSAFSSNTLSFKYFTHLYGGTGDSLTYQVAYDNGTTWTGSYTTLPGTAPAWDSVTITVPAGSPYVRIRFRARINGGSDWAAIDAVKLVSSSVDLVPPIVTGAAVPDAATIKIGFTEMLSATADVLANYTGVPGLSAAARNAAGDSVTLTFSPGFSNGVYDTLTVSGVEDSSGNVLAAPFVFPFVYNASTPPLVITEIMYHGATADEDSSDYIEIYNNGASPAALGGMVLHTGQPFRFPQLTLPPLSFVLLANDSAKASGYYGKPFLQLADPLSNGGETITLRNTVGVTIDSVSYDDAAPWPLGPPSPDGDGPSLELLSPALNNALAASWTTATAPIDTLAGGIVVRGTPGALPSTAAPTISLITAGASHDEAADTVTVGLRISNRNALSSSVKLDLIAGFGTAAAGADFTLLTDSVVFVPGSADTLYARIKINNDGDAERAEYFALQTASSTNTGLGLSRATHYIRDNDYTPPAPRRNITLTHLGSYVIPDSGTAPASAEIVAYDSLSNRLFVVNSLQNELQILSFADATNLQLLDTISLSAYGGGINSVAVHKGLVAVAVEDSVRTANGRVVFLDTAGTFLKSVTVGALPDMLTFTPDGTRVLVANEGEPTDSFLVDPQGSVSIINLSAGVGAATVSPVLFTAYNGQEALLNSLGIRVFGLGATAAQDLEPEYITVNKTGDTAWVALQENNALAVVHIPTASVIRLQPLGYIDHSVATSALDASDNNGTQPLIAAWPVRGLPMPDAIASYNVGGQTYVVTANEGDAREYDGLEEEIRIGAAGYVLDPTAFPHASLLKSSFNLGRLNATSTMGDPDNDGDYDQIYVFGGRSFSIYNGATGAAVWSSGDLIEQITRFDTASTLIFNADNGSNTRKNRSDNKGPEPEGVTIAMINDTTYAFVALERVGGVMVWDVTTPTAPQFVQYINTRRKDSLAGDLGAEGIIFIPRDTTRKRPAYVLTANEVSGSVAVFEVGAAVIAVDPPPVEGIAAAQAQKALRVYPNPVQSGALFFSEPATGVLYDGQGRAVLHFEKKSSVNTGGLAAGVYLLQAEGFAAVRVVVK